MAERFDVLSEGSEKTIKERAAEIRRHIRHHQGEAEIWGARLRVLQRECEHPDKYQYSAMGELGWKCPDCGWAT